MAQITQRFTFFCVFLGFDIMMSIVPGLGEFSLGGLPLLILVSGWRYAGYYIIATELMNLDGLIEAVGKTKMALDTLPSLMSKQGQSAVKATISQFIPHVHAYPHHYLLTFHPPIVQAWEANFVIVPISAVIFYFTAESLSRYLKLLRRASYVAKSWHR